MPHGVKLKWSIEVRHGARWRGYALDVVGSFTRWSYAVHRNAVGVATAAGFYSADVAMTAAELAARMDFAERQAKKKKKTTKR